MSLIKRPVFWVWSVYPSPEWLIYCCAKQKSIPLIKKKQKSIPRNYYHARVIVLIVSILSQNICCVVSHTTSLTVISGNFFQSGTVYIVENSCPSSFFCLSELGYFPFSVRTSTAHLVGRRTWRAYSQQFRLNSCSVLDFFYLNMIANDSLKSNRCSVIFFPVPYHCIMRGLWESDCVDRPNARRSLVFFCCCC